MWFKVDDGFYDHPKVFDAPDCAVALWTRAGCWSARNLTDGFVPAKMPARLCDDPDTAVRELVDRGLWQRARGGFRFHDWPKYQPQASDVLDLRAKRAEAGRKGGQAKAANHSKQTGSKPLASARDVGKQNSTPTRPGPEASYEASGDAATSSPAPPRKTSKATRLPDDFEVTAEMVAWAREHCPDVDGRWETEKFGDHWRGKSGKDATKVDWVATWKNWMRRSQEHTRQRTGPPSRDEQRRRDGIPEAWR